MVWLKWRQAAGEPGAKGFPYPSGCTAEWLAYDADDDLLSISLLGGSAPQVPALRGIATFPDK